MLSIWLWCVFGFSLFHIVVLLLFYFVWSSKESFVVFDIVQSIDSIASSFVLFLSFPAEDVCSSRTRHVNILHFQKFLDIEWSRLWLYSPISIVYLTHTFHVNSFKSTMHHSLLARGITCFLRRIGGSSHTSNPRIISPQYIYSYTSYHLRMMWTALIGDGEETSPPSSISGVGAGAANSQSGGDAKSQFPSLGL